MSSWEESGWELEQVCVRLLAGKEKYLGRLCYCQTRHLHVFFSFIRSKYKISNTMVKPLKCFTVVHRLKSFTQSLRRQIYFTSTGISCVLTPIKSFCKFEEKWLENTVSKLRTYMHFLKNIGLTNMLHLIQKPKIFTIVVQLKAGILPLATEVGKFRGKQIT